MAGSDPAVKAEISHRMLDRFGGDVAAKNHNEFLNIIGINEEVASRGRQKRALGSLIYGTGNVSRYHDKGGQRHFKLLKPFEPVS